MSSWNIKKTVQVKLQCLNFNSTLFKNMHKFTISVFIRIDFNQLKRALCIESLYIIRIWFKTVYFSVLVFLGGYAKSMLLESIYIQNMLLDMFSVIGWFLECCLYCDLSHNDSYLNKCSLDFCVVIDAL